MRRRVDQVLSRILIILMALMVINVLWQVISRYVFNDPSSFTDELAGFLMIWVGLLGAAYATGKGLHLAIDTLHEKLSGTARRRTEQFISICIAVFAAAVLLVGGGRLVYLTLYLEQYSANLNIPIGYVYLALPLSGLLIIFYAVNDLYHDRSPDPSA